MSLTMSGVHEMRNRLNAIGSSSKTLTASGNALSKEAQDILTEARAQTPVGGPPYSPYDKHPGALQASIRTTGPVKSRTAVAAILHAGGGISAAYADPQHERLDYRHHVGKAKFLEDPFMAHSARIRQQIIVEVQAHIETNAK